MTLDHIAEPLRGLAVPISTLTKDGRNARKHSERNLAAIERSLAAFGQQKPVVIAADGRTVIAGNGTIDAALALGWTHIAAVYSHLSGTDATAYGLADNRTAELAEWDHDRVDQLLAELSGAAFDIAMLDFDALDAQKLDPLDIPTGEEEGDQTERQKQEEDAAAAQGVPPPRSAAILERVNVTIAEPKTKITRGSVWHLGRHVLVCESVVSGWAKWMPLLTTEDTLFCPFPGPFVLLTKKAVECRLVLVQPDLYTAGHIVDRWIEIHGDGEVKEQPA